jgi:hypothetical protein
MFSVLVVLSLVVSVATAMLWVRSHYALDRWQQTLADERGWYVGDERIEVLNGRIEFVEIRLDKPAPAAQPIPANVEYEGLPRYGETWVDSIARRLNGFAGFEWGKIRDSVWLPLGGWTPYAGTWSGSGWKNPATVWVLVVPFYAIAPLSVILPTMWLVRRIRNQRRYRYGHCRVCGGTTCGRRRSSVPNVGIAPEGRKTFAHGVSRWKIVEATNQPRKGVRSER